MWPHAGWWSWFNQLFHLARSRTSIFFFLGLQHCNHSISVPNIFDSYLLHANPIVSKTRAKGSAKRECNNPCVGVLFSLDAPLISRLRWVWFPWKKNNICGYTLTCSPSRTKGDLLRLKERNLLRPHRVADLQESFNLRGAFWVDGKFRDFLDPTQTCSKLGAWDLWPFVRKTQRICGESGTQEFRAGGERILTDIVDLQLQTMFSGSQLWRCPGLLSQWKNKESLKSSWVMGFNYKKHMYRTRQNSAFDQPERWFCGMLFLGQELAWGLGCQFPNIFGLSFPVSRSVMFFQLWWVLKLQSQNFLENWQLLMWIEHPKGFPKSEMRTCRKTHLGKTWFNPKGNPQFFTFKDLKFGTTSHSTVMGKAFSSCWQALALPWSWSVWHPGTMLCAW